MIINNRNKNEIKKNTERNIGPHLYILEPSTNIFLIDLKRWS